MSIKLKLGQHWFDGNTYMETVHLRKTIKPAPKFTIVQQDNDEYNKVTRYYLKRTSCLKTPTEDSDQAS